MCVSVCVLWGEDFTPRVVGTAMPGLVQTDVDVGETAHVDKQKEEKTVQCVNATEETRSACP